MTRYRGTPLHAKDVSVRFGGLQALDSVSLEVPNRGIVGLIGPNGAGKTTLFDAVTGVNDPTSGRILLFGRDVTGWPAHRRARLGVGRTFQRLEAFGSLSVEHNYDTAMRDGIHQLLAAKGYVRVRSWEVDDWYVHSSVAPRYKDFLSFCSSITGCPY